MINMGWDSIDNWDMLIQLYCQTILLQFNEKWTAQESSGIEGMTWIFLTDLYDPFRVVHNRSKQNQQNTWGS